MIRCCITDRRLERVVVLLETGGADWIQIRDKELQARFAGTAWTQCDSWYRNGAGRIVANWPGYMSEYAEQTRTLDPAQFTLIPRSR